MPGEHVRRLGNMEYGLGQALDIYEPEHPRGSVAVLLWHGSGRNERDVMEPLARCVATNGVPVIAPDWNTADGGRGRHHLAASLAFTRDLAESMGLVRIVLAGWSLGANAGLDLVRTCSILGGWLPDAFIGLSGVFDDSPYRGPDPDGRSAHPSVPLLLVHGSSDEVVPVGRSRSTFESLRSVGWNVVLREVDTDHAGTIGTTYDPYRRRCVPTSDRARQDLLTTIAGWIADLALSV